MSIETLDTLYAKSFNKMIDSKAIKNTSDFWKYSSICLRILQWKLNK